METIPESDTAIFILIFYDSTIFLGYFQGDEYFDTSEQYVLESSCELNIVLKRTAARTSRKTRQTRKSREIYQN